LHQVSVLFGSVKTDILRQT